MEPEEAAGDKHRNIQMKLWPHFKRSESKFTIVTPLTDEVQKMSQKVLLFKLLLVCCTTQSLAVIQANCNEDVTVDCPGLHSGNMNFLSLTWYKLSEKKHGIIRSSKNQRSPQKYNFTRSASFGDKYSLFLTSVTPEDSGAYECAISANVGGQNQNLQVELIVNECATEANLTTNANVLNTTQPNLVYVQAQDLPIMWSFIGYVAVAIGKMVLSLISIWIIRAVHKRSSRRWHDEC